MMDYESYQVLKWVIALAAFGLIASLVAYFLCLDEQKPEQGFEDDSK